MHGCPLGCARDRTGAACSNRGQCVWEKAGATCRCDPGTTGAACDEDVNGGPRARARWRFAIIVLVVSLCAAVVAARCVAFRKRRLATLRARGPTRPSTPTTTRTASSSARRCPSTRSV